MKCQCKRHRRNPLMGWRQSQAPQNMYQPSFQQHYEQNNMMNEQRGPVYGGGPFQQHGPGMYDPSVYGGGAPETFQGPAQGSYYQQGNWDAMPNMQGDWQNNQWENGQMAFPEQHVDQMMPPQNYTLPQQPQQQHMIAQQYPEQTQGMMPQTGYIPEEHDDDFD